MMVWLRWCCVCFPAWLFVCACLGPVTANERDFPFGREMILDTAPMAGSKRVPILEIDENGAAGIVRGGAANPRRKPAGIDRAGDELAAQRQCDRTSRRLDVAVPADDE